MFHCSDGNCGKMLTMENCKFKSNGEFYKNCNVCRVRKARWREKDKCPYNKKTSTCHQCKKENIGGNGLCIHDKERNRCKDCKRETLLY